jgi:FkbM family methyltransferase
MVSKLLRAFYKSLTVKNYLKYVLKGQVWRVIVSLKGDFMHTFKLRDGSQFEYPFNSAVGANLFVGKFEEVEVNWFCQTVQPGDIVLDVGANGGLYTLLASKLVGSNGHVYAFEPGERELNLLRNNISRNNLSNVTVVDKAVSDKKSSSNFVVSQDGAMNSLARNTHMYQEVIDNVVVETISLDDFVEDCGISKVNVVKVDVEGAEHLVLRGMKKLLSTSPQVKILFECSDSTASGFDYSAQSLLRDLKKDNLEISFIGEDLELVDIEKYPAPADLGVKIYNFVATCPN